MFLLIIISLVKLIYWIDITWWHIEWEICWQFSRKSLGPSLESNLVQNYSVWCIYLFTQIVLGSNNLVWEPIKSREIAHSELYQKFNPSQWKETWSQGVFPTLFLIQMFKYFNCHHSEVNLSFWLNSEIYWTRKLSNQN